jgi:tetratricopeptide (TPR) repeat protein
MDEMLLSRCYAALVFDEIEEYEDAIARFSKAIEADSANYIVLNNRGVAYLEIGRYEEALADFSAAARLARAGDPIPHRNLEAFQGRRRE